MGKGDKQRPRKVSREQYENNFDAWIKKLKEQRKNEQNKIK